MHYRALATLSRVSLQKYWRLGMDFTRELETYEEHLLELLAHEGSYVVVHGTSISGPHDRYEDALREGYDRYGVVPFLVKQIHRPEAEPIHYFSRDLPQCTS